MAQRFRHHNITRAGECGDKKVKTSCIAIVLLALCQCAAADTKVDTARNMCTEFARNKPVAQRNAFIAECLQSMLSPQTVVVFPDTEPINIPRVMSDGKAWFLAHFAKMQAGSFRGERLVKYTRHRPIMSIPEAKAQGLKTIPVTPEKQLLIYCGEYSTDGTTYRWFAVEANSETVGRKGKAVEFEPPPLRLTPWEDEKGVCISGVKLS